MATPARPLSPPPDAPLPRVPLPEPDEPARRPGESLGFTWPPAERPRRAYRSARLFAVALLVPLASALLARLDSDLLGPAAVIGLIASPVLAFLGVRAGVAELEVLRRESPRDRLALAVTGVVTAVSYAYGVALVATFAKGIFRGRQLRRFGHVLLPPLRQGATWATIVPAVAVPEAEREGLARQWRENGRTEHASVAAFARLDLDLIALGAPPRLVAAAHRDALDEIRHAELCFGLARALDGLHVGPAAFPEPGRVRSLPRTRTLALAALAVDSLVDGALHEGLSARVLARLVGRCEDAATREVLRELAADEGRHSAHGWQVVEWCLAEGGRPVASALRGAVSALPRTVHPVTSGEASGGAWERWGIPGHELEAQAHAAARDHVVRRIEGLLASGATRAA